MSNMEKNNFEAAVKCYQQMISISAKYNEKAIDLGEQLLKKRQAKLAFKLFDQALSRKAKQNPVRERVIDICMKNCEMQYAQKILNAYLRLNPKKYEMVYKAGVLANAIGDSNKAIDYFKKVEKNRPDHLEAKLQLAYLYIQKGKVIIADTYINQVLKTDPENRTALALRKQI